MYIFFSITHSFSRGYIFYCITRSIQDQKSGQTNVWMDAVLND